MRTKLSDGTLTVVFLERGWWVAQALEHDICAQGKTPTLAMASLSDVMKFQAEIDKEDGKEPLADFPPAPQEYWEM